MKLAFRITALGTMALSIIGCGSSSFSENRRNPGSHPSGMGPFDSRGNYVEEWADNPSQWKRGGSSKPKKSREPEIQVEDPPMIAQNEQPPATSIPLGPRPNVTSSSTPASVSRPSSATKPATAAAKPKPKPKPVVAKTKPKAPASTRYLIKKGDTLSSIARRHKTTITAIQRANGISGSLIHPGKSLVIPKY